MRLSRWLWALLFANCVFCIPLAAQTCTGFAPYPNSDTCVEVDQVSAPSALTGALGAGASISDPALGNQIVRCTDRNSGANFRGYRMKSDSNDNVWNVGNTVFAGVQTGSGVGILIAWNGTSCTPKGTATSVFNGELVSPSHVDANKFFGTQGPLVVAGELNPNSTTWTSSTNANNDVSAAFTVTTVQDLSASNCLGTDYINMNTSDLYAIDSADRFLNVGLRFAQDEGFQTILIDTTKAGCHWIDWRRMMEGGSWGHVGSVTSGITLLLPHPPAPSVTATTGGSLTQGHQYAVVVNYTKNDVGPSGSSPVSLITVSAPNNRISVSAPSATPTGTATVPTGYRVQVCDRTLNSTCSPKDQINTNNGSGVFSRAVIASVTCSSNCTPGTTTYTFWAWNINAGGQSPRSLPVTAPACAACVAAPNAKFSVAVQQDSHATGYSIAVNNNFVVPVNNQAGSCNGTTCTFTVNTNPANGGFIRENETAPISTTPFTVDSLLTDNNPPTVNASGGKFHNVRSDISGTWLTPTITGAQEWNSTYSPALVPYSDVLNGRVVWLSGSGPDSTSLNIAGNGHSPTVGLGHRAVGSGTVYGLLGGGGGDFGYVTLNDAEVKVTATDLWQNANPKPSAGSSDVHLSTQTLSGNLSNPVYIGSDGAGYMSHAVPTTDATLEVFASSQSGSGPVWRFCEDWESGLQGFNSEVSGNISSDGTVIAFSSDMGVGTGVTSGQVGSTSNGGNTCTDNSDCATDIYICLPK